ncbi:MAG TPA: histidine--tRNA ligase [archaeon]|nr:histidine--tRNA ligase [archaeon]
MSPAPKGMRDFGPDAMILRNQVFSRLETIFESFGFDPLETPVVEMWETIKGKYGDEAENQMVYHFKDSWGGKEMALRYDLTVPLARFMAENPTVPMPFCRYHIGRVYRHDQPQKGRYREFWQCDVDVVGSDKPEADALIIKVVLAVMKEFGFKQFTVRLNDRRLLNGIFTRGLGVKNFKEVLVAVDKINKIGLEGVEKEIRKIEPDKVTSIVNVLKIRGGNQKILDEIVRTFDNEEVRSGKACLEKVLALVGDDRVKIDLSMVRGLDYYTGPIFETVVEKPKIGSLTGGGRYDSLIGLYGGRDLPATGTTIGVERLIDAGLELGVFRRDTQTPTQVGIIAMDGGDAYAWKVAETLRLAGLKVKIDLMQRKWNKQSEYYKKLGVPVMVFVGEREIREQTSTVVFGQKRDSVKFEKLPEKIRNLLKV